MKATIVKIGNSRGIRIPKPVFEQCGFSEEVELEVEDSKLVIRSMSSPRKGWEDSFRAMGMKEDDSLDSDFEVMPNDWDRTNWQWKSVDSKSI